jgi:hypothetical protein
VVGRELSRARALAQKGVPAAAVAREAARASDAVRGPVLAAALFPGEA